MAVPMVAGAAALMFVARPLATAAQIKVDTSHYRVGVHLALVGFDPQHR